MDDKVLVQKVLAGDQWAFRELIKKYQRLVGHMITRLVDNDQDREEISQDVFVKVYESLSTFKFDSKLSTWMATIAYRMALNFLKKRKRRLQMEEDLDKVDFQLGHEDLSVENLNYAAFIQSLIAKMPVHYRTVLTLYHLEGFSYPEIVEVTGMPEGTVKNYLFRARSKLKELSAPYMGKEIHHL